jgi:hypothetical protein
MQEWWTHRTDPTETIDILQGSIAMAISSKEYAEHKDDLEKLREVSVWQTALASSMLLREVSLTKLVRDFHRQFERK